MRIKLGRHFIPWMLISTFLSILPGCGEAEKRAPDLFLRDAIYFEVETDEHTRPILDNVMKYAKLFGFAPVMQPDRAAYAVSGTLECRALEPVKLDDAIVQYKWTLSADLKVSDTATGALLEQVTVPSQEKGAADKDRAYYYASKACASKAAQFLFFDGQALGRPGIRNLLADLLIESTEGRLFNDIMESLVDAGREAVPFLIWKLNDRRRVALPGDLPGLTDELAGHVKVYHVANRALERILNRETGLHVTRDTDRAFVNKVQLGWFMHWRKMCGAYLWGDALHAILDRKKLDNPK